MVTQILTAIGGVGLFLLGMLILTDGLKALAGNALRRVLAYYTRSPTSGALTGACTTAIIQSSSATTVTTVGLVGAGLLTFPQALGVIFGANIGTTATGWIVALLGFKLQLGLVVLPGVMVGALMRMFGRRKVRHAGMVLAGFCLLIIGIETMQLGMEGIDTLVTPDSFPPDTLWGRLQMLMLGVLIVLITQSSSAGVATAMVALASGAINLPQGAAMVIGMDVGTTFTAALATVGGSTPMRRTGFAHVIYNFMSGVAAFFLLEPFTLFVSWWQANGSTGTPQMLLVGFHTFFNGLGVILILPFTNAFARMMIHLFPEKNPSLVRHLDDKILATPAAAIDVAWTSGLAIADASLSVLRTRLNPAKSKGVSGRLLEIDRSISALYTFVRQINIEEKEKHIEFRLVCLMHILDHLRRLNQRMRQGDRIDLLMQSQAQSGHLKSLLSTAKKVRHAHDAGAGVRLVETLYETLQHAHKHAREATIASYSGHADEIEDIALRLDSERWLQRVSYHLWRIQYHIAMGSAEAPPSTKGSE